MIQPTPHPFTDTSETEAVDILKSLLDHSKVKSDIKERDKHPNIDGYLELVDEFSIPIGKLEVQIKKISDELLNPPRVECKISFLGYCKESQLPVILIGVNIKNKKAYWIHLDNKKVNSYKFKEKQKKKIISLPFNQIIDGKTKNYIGDWKKIINNEKEKVKYYNKLNQEIEYIGYDLDDLIYNNMSKIKLKGSSLNKIQIFLDSLNLFFDSDFNIIKKVLFPSVWKFGIAISDFGEKKISYILFPIQDGINVPLIRQFKVKTNIFDKIDDLKGIMAYSSYSQNPIYSDPKKYAKQFVWGHLEKLLKHKALKNDIDKNLAIEFCFEFINKFNIQLGIEKKESHNIDDIYFGFNKYLPTWIDEVLKYISKNSKKLKQLNYDLFSFSGRFRNFLDPGALLTYITPYDISLIDESVYSRIKKEDYNKRVMIIGNEKYSFNLFAQYIDYLKKLNISTIIVANQTFITYECHSPYYGKNRANPNSKAYECSRSD